MREKKEQNKLAAESIKRAIESIENGIAVEHHDHLSMDAYGYTSAKTVRPSKSTLSTATNGVTSKREKSSSRTSSKVPQARVSKCA